MIKAESNKSKNIKKTIIQIAIEYARTVFISFVLAIIITTLLTVRARNEMLKNLYANDSERQKIDEQIAMQIVSQSDLTDSLQDKNYAVCLQVGNLYETAHDYVNAEFSYRLAVGKAKRGVFTPYQKLAGVLIAQEKFDEAVELIESVPDLKNKHLVKFKTQVYMKLGDKYYSIGKFLKAARSFERAKFYYDRFAKQDKKIVEALDLRIMHSYVNAADIIVKQGYNTDAVRFLKKALKYDPNNNIIKYKLAVIYTDLDPLTAVEYFEPLLNKIPQNIDYTTYNRALMKAANICDLEGNSIKAKYYRYKIHSIDLFVNNKVVYKNDIDTQMKAFKLSHILFRYGFKMSFVFNNVSSTDILNLTSEFVLRQGDKTKEILTIKCVDRDNPLFSNGGSSEPVIVKFKKKLFTRKEFVNYKIDVYLYKDEKYKTLVATFDLPQKTYGQIK